MMESKNDSAVMELPLLPKVLATDYPSKKDICADSSLPLVEKIDELTSLEREIAEMHHVDPSSPALAQRVNNIGESEDAQRHMDGTVLLLEMETSNGNETGGGDERTTTPAAGSVEIHGIGGSDAFEREDLIAVLKGNEDGDLTEGVTIEGEGQFQIMEVIDDEGEDLMEIENDGLLKAPIARAAPGKKFGIALASVMTDDEIRAVAMEQIADLGQVDRQRRRKQDIKPLVVEENADLVASLEAEWSDDDPCGDQEVLSGKRVPTSGIMQKSNTDVCKIQTQTMDQSIPTDVAEKSGSGDGAAMVMLSDENATTKKGKDKANSGSAATKKNISSEAAAISLQAQSTGFKRTRVIKRKIIWDPDAPETQFSYAKLVRHPPKSQIETTTKSPTLTATSVTTKASTLTTTTAATTTTMVTTASHGNSSVAVKKEASAKRVRPTTPKEKKNAGTGVGQKSRTSGKVGTSTGSNNISQGTNDTPVKRRSQTPVANGGSVVTAGGKKKKGTEIDRLMGDEGAVNMLNSLENEHGKLVAIEDDDKPHKPLMRSRAATISERVMKREREPTPTGTKKDSGPGSASGVGTKGKRGSKQKPSSSWDYVYKQKATEDSMIIRRRSNSSYSSNASAQRLSLDAPLSTSATPASTNSASSDSPDSSSAPTKLNSATKMSSKAVEEISPSGNNSKQSGKGGFEFAKPESKSNQKASRRNKSSSESIDSLTNDMKKDSQSVGAVVNKRSARSPVEEKEKNTKATSKENVTSDVVVKKVSKVAQIVFSTHKAKTEHTFTAQMMNKLVDILDSLSKDANCHVVVMTSSSANFCHGIDFSNLITGSIEKRKHAAVELATAVKNYLRTLATFPKPLIAGVNGSNIGLGVMQLPLYDIVIASDKGSYETPYAKFGQMPEGYCIWNNLTKIRDTFKVKLFWLCEKLHSTESALSGLVNKLTTSNKVNEEALIMAKKIAAMPPESFRLMKKTTIHNHLDTIMTGLDEEFDVIIEQWTSADFFEKLKKYLETKNV